MPKRLFRPSAHLIKQWPEVFEDLYMNTMPLFYLDDLTIEFTDGSIWELDIKTQLQLGNDPESTVEKIIDIFEEYHESIHNIKFNLDTEKLKKDIEDKTKNMLG